MTHWTASVVAMSLASFPVVASAQPNCEAIPRGPERTDCYLALSQFLSCTIGPGGCQGTRAIRRRVVPGNYRNRSSKT
jgi:hypothetical protein